MVSMGNAFLPALFSEWVKGGMRERAAWA